MRKDGYTQNPVGENVNLLRCGSTITEVWENTSRNTVHKREAVLSINSKTPPGQETADRKAG